MNIQIFFHKKIIATTHINKFVSYDDIDRIVQDFKELGYYI